MKKKFANFFLLALPFLLNSCSKDVGHQPSQFEINGVHDVFLDGSGRNMLLIDVNQTSGSSEPVDIEVFDLPIGIPVEITQENGLPDFGSKIYFFEGGPPGIYRVKVTATSTHCYREASLLVFAPGNDFTVNGTRDISLNNATYTDTMSVTVAYVSGVREKVQLEVFGLPAGVYANVQSSSSTPDFTSKIIFRRPTPLVKAGTYPIRILGRNSSYSKVYDVNLTTP